MKMIFYLPTRQVHKLHLANIEPAKRGDEKRKKKIIKKPNKQNGQNE